MPPNTATYTCIIDGYGKVRWRESPLWSPIRDLKLACTSQVGRLDDAFSVLHSMRLAGVAPNVATFTALLSSCVASDSPSQASLALALMPANGLDPTDLPGTLLARVAQWSG